MLSVKTPERTDQNRGQANLALEKVEKGGSMLDSHVYVLDDQFVMKAEQLAPELPQPNAWFPIDGFLVEGRVQILASQQSANDLVLRMQQSRTPEPVGIPLPDVVESCEVIALTSPD